MNSISSILTIVLNWNGKSDTLDCLRSLQEARLDSSILVVDNGSQDDSILAIREYFPQVTLLETGQNLGYAAGNNEGIKWGLERGFTYFLILNNDTEVAPDLFEEFSHALEKYPEVGVFGSKIYLKSDPKRLDHLGGNWNNRRAEIEFIGMHVLDDGKSFEQPIQLDYVCGAAFLVRRSVFEKVGLLDPRYFLYWEENDFCFRARREGFAVQVCPGAKVWHKVSSTTSKEGKLFRIYFFWRNYLLWLENNLPWNKKCIAYTKLAKEISTICWKFPWKWLKVCIWHKIWPEMNLLEQQKQISQKFALLCGVKDYFLRRFGLGSSSRFSGKS